VSSVPTRARFQITDAGRRALTLPLAQGDVSSWAIELSSRPRHSVACHHFADTPLGTPIGVIILRLALAVGRTFSRVRPASERRPPPTRAAVFAGQGLCAIIFGPDGKPVDETENSVNMHPRRRAVGCLFLRDSRKSGPLGVPSRTLRRRAASSKQ
jgi:hypothetical protein